MTPILLEGRFERLTNAYIDIGKMGEDHYKEKLKELETEKAEVERDFRRAVNSLNEPERKNEAIKRASDRGRCQLNQFT